MDMYYSRSIAQWRFGYISWLCCVAFIVTGNGCTTNERAQLSFHGKHKFVAEKSFFDPAVVRLCKAIESSDMEAIDRELQAGADVNAKGVGNMTPLMWAYPDNKIARFERLLRAGADPNVIFTSDFGCPTFFRPGDSVMHLCARGQFVGYFDLVIKHGGDANLRDARGDTILHAIIMGGVPDAENRVKLAIAAGAEVDAYDSVGNTPIIAAIAWFRQFHIAEVLIHADADPKIFKRGQLQSAIHLILRSEQELNLLTVREIEDLRSLKKAVVDNGYDCSVPLQDLKRWSSWGEMAPEKAARLRREELGSRKERTKMGIKE